MEDYESPQETGKTYSILTDDLIVFYGVEYDDCGENPSEDWDGFGKFHSFGRDHINYYRGDPADLLFFYKCRHCDYENPPSDVEDRYVFEKFGHKVYQCPYCGLWTVLVRMDRDAVPLGYFEHGMCDWHVSGEVPYGTEGDYRWDGVSFAGVWEATEDIIKEADDEGLERGSAERYAWMEERARQSCETYTYWCNGEIYYYFVRAYKPRPINFDFNEETGEMEYDHDEDNIYDELHDYRYDDEVYVDACGCYYGWDKYLEQEIESSVRYALKKSGANNETEEGQNA